ncbi:DNA-binding transcriptional regulator, LysR family [Sphingobium faniae]|nr:DNA-binding transcriptional regulator, LysR family [Sphingobium faniae]
MRGLDLKAVRYFVAVVEARSFSGAASRLGLAQPSVSEKVKQLEAELGYLLFDRSHRQITLTAEGKAFLEIALRCVVEMDRLHASARQIGGQDHARIVIGCSSASTSAPERDRLVDEFMRREPDVSVRIQSMEPKPLLEAYWRAEIDLLMIGAPLPEGIATRRNIILCEQYGMLFVPRESPLRDHEVIPLAALQGQTIAVFPAISHPELCLDVYRLLRDHGASLLEIPEANFITLQNFARRRRICALTVDSMASFAGDSLIARPLEGNPFRSTLHLIEPGAAASTAARRMWRLACRVAQAPVVTSVTPDAVRASV